MVTVITKERCVVATLTVVFDIILAKIMKPQMFPRILMHIQFGSIGSYLVAERPTHGLVYMFLLTVYQALEFCADPKLDQSWVDVEGYLVGFTSATLYLIYLSKTYSAGSPPSSQLLQTAV